MIPDFSEINVRILIPIHIRAKVWSRPAPSDPSVVTLSSGVAAQTHRQFLPYGIAWEVEEDIRRNI